MDVITCKSVSKNFGKNKALSNVTFSVKKGTIFTIVGRNGAGKSTLMKILTGQLKETSGECSVLNVSTKQNSVEVRKISGIIPEQESPSSFLTPQEYLEFCLDIREIENKSKISYWMDFLEFGADKDVLIKDISRGTKQKVMVAQAFIHEPEIVFIDEPLVNLDPLIQKKVKKYIKEYVKKGNTVIISTHLLSLAEELSDEILVLDKGEKIGHQKYRDIKKMYKNLEKYFMKVVNCGK